MKSIWHIVWNTYQALPPHDKRGDWIHLSKLYRELYSEGFHPVFSRELADHYSAVLTQTVDISFDESVNLADWLLELTARNGDRVAGNSPVIASAFMSQEAHIVFHCSEESLSQVVGRLKSRLAGLLLNAPHRRGQKHVWGKGFWSAKLVEPTVVERAVGFVQALSANQALQPTCTAAQYTQLS